MLTSLREATRELHNEIEQENLANRIMDHSISLEEYKLLLLQNFIAYKVTESEIRKELFGWDSDKSDRLKKDLENLQANLSIAAEFEDKFKINNEAEALGAAYVLEGSALGGMQIAKELPRCKSLSELPQQHFFVSNRKFMEGWNIFLKKIRNTEFSEEEKEQAAIKAQETFIFFREVFQLRTEEAG